MPWANPSSLWDEVQDTQRGVSVPLTLGKYRISNEPNHHVLESWRKTKHLEGTWANTRRELANSKTAELENESSTTRQNSGQAQRNVSKNLAKKHSFFHSFLYVIFCVLQRIPCIF